MRTGPAEGRKVLVVDDEAMAAMALGAYLEDLGYEVLDFPATGEEAIRIADAEDPAIVFMDVNLPGGMDGIEAAERIKSRGPVSIVFMTGYSSQSVGQRASALSPLAFLVKPFDFSAIDGILASLRS